MTSRFWFLKVGIVCGFWGMLVGVLLGEEEEKWAREDFEVAGSRAFVILPAEGQRVEGKVPWVWYAPTLPKSPAKEERWMFERFLAKGIAIAGVDVGESYGSPAGRVKFSELYRHLVAERGFGERPCLLARSRGGLMMYAWAAENAEKVSGVAGIYPVCDLESYPGLERAAGAYGLTAEELREKLSEHNPIERLGELANAVVPIFHIHGDEDEVVPYERNTKVLVERYQDLGGPAEVELVAGRGHDLWEGWFQSERLTEFAIERALGVPLSPMKRLNFHGIRLDKEKRVVDLEAKICLAEGALELLACREGTKEHESVVAVRARPMHIHASLLLLGAVPGSPPRAIQTEEGGWLDLPPSGGRIAISLVFTGADGKEKELAVKDFVEANDDEGEAFPHDYFLFTGSILIPQDEGAAKYLCDESGNLITLSGFGDELLGLADIYGHGNGELAWRIKAGVLPGEGTEVILRLKPVVEDE